MTETGSKYLRKLAGTVACSAVLLLGAPSGPADAADTGFFTIRSKVSSTNLTTLQKNKYWKSIKGTKVIWTGRVLGVSDELFGTGAVVSIDMDRKAAALGNDDDVLIVVGKNLGETLRVNQKITFSGKLDDYSVGVFGNVSFQLKNIRVVKVG